MYQKGIRQSWFHFCILRCSCMYSLFQWLQRMSKRRERTYVCRTLPKAFSVSFMRKTRRHQADVFPSGLVTFWSKGFFSLSKLSQAYFSINYLSDWCLICNFVQFPPGTEQFIAQCGQSDETTEPNRLIQGGLPDLTKQTKCFTIFLLEKGRCVWLGLELNSARRWLSRNMTGNTWSTNWWSNH